MVLGLPSEVAALCNVSLARARLLPSWAPPAPSDQRCLQSPRLQGLRITQLLEPSLHFPFMKTHVLDVLTMQAAILSLAAALERIDYFVYMKV